MTMLKHRDDLQKKKFCVPLFLYAVVLKAVLSITF